MKTAMQQLFDNLENLDKKVPDYIQFVFIQKEKEQLIDAWDKSRMLIDWPTNGNTFYHTRYSKPPKK